MSYNVKCNEYYCTWEEDISELPRNTVVYAGQNTIILYYENGSLSGTYYPEDKDKRDRLVVRTRRSRNDEESVVGVNYGKEFSIEWGVGEVPYSDKRGLETQIGMNGEYKFKVTQPQKLIQALGKYNITPRDVKEFTAARLQEKFKTKLAQRTRDLDYGEVVTVQSALSSDIEEEYNEELERLGLMLTSFSLKAIFFPEEYIEARKQAGYDDPTGIRSYVAQLQDKERQKAEEEDAIRTLNMLKAASDAAYPGVNTSNNNGNVSDGVRYCPKCGKALKEGDIYCNYCGKKL